MGLDLLTGQRRWQLPLNNSADFIPLDLVPSPSVPSRLYYIDCDTASRCNTVHALLYHGFAGLSVLWSRRLCGVTYCGGHLLPFPFPSGTEVVLLTQGVDIGTQWTTLDGSTGSILHQDTVLSPWYSPALMGNASDGRLFLTDPGRDVNTTAESYQVNSSGQWSSDRLCTIRWDVVEHSVAVDPLHCGESGVDHAPAVTKGWDGIC